MDNKPFWEPVFSSWDVREEQSKADFMEYLYQVYKPESHHFTGIWEKFKEECAVSVRNAICSEDLRSLMELEINKHE